MQPMPRLHRQLLDELHAVDAVCQLRQDRRLVAHAGADLEHGVGRLQYSKSVITATMKGCEMVLPKPIGNGRLT